MCAWVWLQAYPGLPLTRFANFCVHGVGRYVPMSLCLSLQTTKTPRNTINTQPCFCFFILALVKTEAKKRPPANHFGLIVDGRLMVCCGVAARFSLCVFGSVFSLMCVMLFLSLGCARKRAHMPKMLTCRYFRMCSPSSPPRPRHGQ